MDKVDPSQSIAESAEENTSELEAHMPKRYQSGRARASDVEAQPAPSDEDHMGIIDGEFETWGDRLVHISGRGEWEFGRVFTTSRFIDQGIITCPENAGADLALELRHVLSNDIYFMVGNTGIPITVH